MQIKTLKRNRLKKSREQKRSEAEARNKVSRERSVLSKRIDELEKRLDEKTTRKAELEKELARPDAFSDPQKGSELYKEYDLLQKSIASIETEWEMKSGLLL